MNTTLLTLALLAIPAVEWQGLKSDNYKLRKLSTEIIIMFDWQILNGINTSRINDPDLRYRLEYIKMRLKRKEFSIDGEP